MLQCMLIILGNAITSIVELLSIGIWLNQEGKTRFSQPHAEEEFFILSKGSEQQHTCVAHIELLLVYFIVIIDVCRALPYNATMAIVLKMHLYGQSVIVVVKICVLTQMGSCRRRYTVASACVSSGLWNLPTGLYFQDPSKEEWSSDYVSSWY